MDEIDHLIIGGGAAAATAAEMLRMEGAGGSILMLSADDRLPYYRPAISKQMLLGQATDAQILLHSEQFYAERDIAIRLQTRAAALDPAAHAVTTADGGQYRYRRLLIATGARPRRLRLPGEDMPGVFHMRSATDCVAVRTAIAQGARHAVVVGASFLGMEIAMSLLELGLQLTVIEQTDQVLHHLESKPVSDYFQRHAEEKGARFLMEDRLVAIHGAGRVREVDTLSGRRMPCDLLVVSIGVDPETHFLDGSAIERTASGLVVVDDQLRASHADIFAAGDVTSFADPVFNQRRHIEHWDNAIKQGRLAARNMVGRRMRYDEVSYFFCDVGDISFSMLGMPEVADEHVVRGSLDSRSLALFYLQDNVLRALFSVGRPTEETRSAQGLIRYRVNLGEMKARLSDPDYTLDHIPTQTVLVLQGGGAMGAFECGVVRALEEERIFPDIVAGISIGALNGAIVAANPRHAAQALQSFWDAITVEIPPMVTSELSSAVAAARILTFGVPNFFHPRWLSFDALVPLTWTSFYDSAPMRSLIARYVDFPALKKSPVRLLVGAVDVASGELAVFDSYVDELTPDHILASGSLPPGFPWTEIDGRVYWDGGIISNSPLDMVIDRCGPDGKRVFIVDLFAGQRPLPANIMEVMARRDEIVYSERVRSDLRLRELTSGYRGLVDGLMELMDPDAASRIRQRPLYIELMGDGARMDVTRFVRVGRTGEPSSRDYDFSDIAVADNIAQGYALVRQQLEARRPHAAMLDSAAPPRPTRPQMQKGALASLAESDRLVDEVDAAARRAPGTRDR